MLLQSVYLLSFCPSNYVSVNKNSYLLIVQIDNCRQNQTTYEKYSHPQNQNNLRLKEVVKYLIIQRKIAN